MPYAPHFRLTMSGTIGTVERFSMGLSLVSSGTPFGDIGDDEWDDVAEDCALFFGNAALGIAETCTLREVKVAPIGADGLYTGDPWISQPMSIAGGGDLQATGAVTLPPQVACAVSLATNKRGPRGRGRMYLPPLYHGLNPATYTLYDGARDAIATATKTFLDNIQNEEGIDSHNLRVVVASSFGQNHPVTGVRVGLAYDTVRSRRADLPESYDPPLALADSTAL